MATSFEALEKFADVGLLDFSCAIRFARRDGIDHFVMTDDVAK